MKEIRPLKLEKLEKPEMTLPMFEGEGIKIQKSETATLFEKKGIGFQKSNQIFDISSFSKYDPWNIPHFCVFFGSKSLGPIINLTCNFQQNEPTIMA